MFLITYFIAMILVGFMLIYYFSKEFTQQVSQEDAFLILVASLVPYTNIVVLMGLILGLFIKD